jgi:putative dimethyl sulfoxide reductase chaperone
VTTPDLDQQNVNINSILARATLYSALALGFRPPTAQTLARLGREEGNRALSDAATVLDKDGILNLTSTILQLRRDDWSLPKLETTFARLFGHTAQGVVSPYETEYGAEAPFQQPHDLGDLSGFYLAFGLALKGDVHERGDHISCECEFLAFLALKELYAVEKEDLPMIEEVRKAGRLFLRDHLARFAPTFAHKLGVEDPDGLYGALGDLCLKLVTCECRRLNIPLGMETLGLRPATDDRVPLGCGNGLECTAMPGAFDPDN